MMNCVVVRNKKGVAMVVVIVLLFVLSLMGTAMYAYSMNSLRSVRFLSDRKKAEYLAQAGVEAVAYAYQLAVDSDNTNAVNFIATSSAEGAEITTNQIYLIWNKTDGTGDNSKGYHYLTEDQLDSYTDKEIIGYYQVTITNRIDERTTTMFKSSTSGNESLEAYEVTLKDRQRLFTSVGCTYDTEVKATKQAFLSEPVQALGSYYDATGTNAGIIDGSASDSTPTNENFSVLGQYTTDSKLVLSTSLLGNLEINVGSRNIPILMGYSSGNMVLNKPSNGTISFKTNQDNMVSFIAINDLFVKSDIDVTSSKSNFNFLFLRGNNIVIDGDIEIYVYGFTRNIVSYWVNNILTVTDAIQGKYRMGTVVIGTPSTETSTVTDPVSTSVYSNGRCGKIYFGGDVFINIEMPNVGTYRYKAFSAGSAYYYNDDMPRSTTAGDSAYGIDLLKYFLDYSIASKKYSDNVLNRFKDLINTYYETSGTTPVTYVTGDGNGNITKDSMREIDIDKWSQDTYSSLIPPDPTDASTLYWGTP